MHLQETTSEDPSRIEKPRGSVEIVEVSLTEDEESEKELNKSQIEDIVHISKPSVLDHDDQISEVQTTEIVDEKPDLEPKVEPSEEDTEEEKSKTEPLEEESTTTWTTTTESKESASTIEETSEISETSNEIKKELNVHSDVEHQSSDPTSIIPEFSEDLFNEINIEIKVDAAGGVKRDYSRTKKKEEKGEFLLIFNRFQKKMRFFFIFVHA